MILKICGLTDNGPSRVIAQLTEVTHVGFIFYDKSVRYTASSFTTNKKKVGVFVNQEINAITDLAEEHQLDTIQLHGNETPDFIAKLPNGLEIFKALGIGSPADLLQTATFQGLVNTFLFDKKSKDFGGTGEHFNWQILEHYENEIPFILSGGIGLNSLHSLEKFEHPQFAGLDLNSRFELEPKIKNVTLIKQFIHAVL